MQTGGRKNYAYLLKRHVLPVLGNVAIHEITVERIQKLVQSMLDRGYAVQSHQRLSRAPGTGGGVLLEHVAQVAHPCSISSFCIRL
jgi:hypothetical protein